MTALLSLLLPLAFYVACSESDPRAEDWSQHYQAGRAALGQSRFTEAEQALSQALTIAETFDSDDPRYDRTAHQLAQLHVVRGELARAESLYQHLRERQVALPDDHPDKMLTLDKLGDTYRLRQRPPRSTTASSPFSRCTEAMKKSPRPCRSYPTSTEHGATTPRPIPSLCEPKP